VIRVMEVATFYTMFNLEPVGKHFIQLCGTTPCGLRGAGEIRKILERRVGEQNRVSPDGIFSWLEVECLGACCNAPMVQINDVYYEDLTPASFEQLLDDLQAERPVRKGSQVGRNTSEPQGAVNTLTDPTLFDGSVVGSWRKRFEEAAVQTGEDAAAEASMPEKSKVGRPLVGRPNETEAVDTPAERAKRGETPISPAAEKAASDPTRATAVEARQEDASESAPQSTKSYVATPSNPTADRPVASQPTSPQAGTPPSEATTRRDGAESKQDVIVDHKDVKRPD
jgi:NADH-quinone oxidoreductase subunit E